MVEKGVKEMGRSRYQAVQLGDCPEHRGLHLPAICIIYIYLVEGKNTRTLILK